MTDEYPPGRPTASVVIPAHNEQSTIGRTLRVLLADAHTGEFDVVVVCNGCTDQTAERAGDHRVRVLEIPEASKYAALSAGNRATSDFPRIYLDADIEMSTASARLLRDAISGRILAAAPEREIPVTGVSRLVRAYYRVWLNLPQVRSGLFGRGVVAVSEVGYERIASLGPVLSDDLAMSEAFAVDERTIVPGATSVVRPPRTLADLQRRRVRVHTGVHQLDTLGGRSPASKTSGRDLLQIVRRRPALIVDMPIFLAIALTARRRARTAIRTGDYASWLRDESSRSE